jgi:drug/metabolite transporter (DMT)-like permease
LVLGWALAGEILSARVVVGGLVVIAAIAWMSRATSPKDEVAKMVKPASARLRSEKEAA